MKLTELQRHEIDEALVKSSGVLNNIKRRVLKGKALEAMKLLESAIQDMELFRLLVR